MAKKHTTTPYEIAAMQAMPDPTTEPDMDTIIDEATEGEPAPEAAAAAPVIILEPWDSDEIQAMQINWQTKSETREIGVPLTREEIQDHATRLADTVTEIRELEDAKKASADHYKALIVDQEKIQNRVSALIRQGHDTKPVPCVWLFEVAGRNDSGAFIRDPNYKTIIRKDTGAVIEVKPITADDRQMGLPLDDLTGTPNEEEGFALDGDLPPLPVQQSDDQVTQAMLEACYDCGSNAHREGEPMAEGNPYPADTKQHTAWENGWRDADADAAAGLV